MRRFVGPALLLSSAFLCGASVVRYCPGCIDRARVNSRCEWTDPSSSPLDLGKPADRAHLVADAQLAEDLAVRYSDAEFGRLYGYEGHGGLLDNRRVVNGCMTRLFATIEASQSCGSACGRRSGSTTAT